MANLGWAGLYVCAELMDGLKCGSLGWPHLHVWQLASGQLELLDVSQPPAG